VSDTERLGNDPRWGTGIRKLAAAVIKGAPATAEAAICTVFSAGEAWDCTVEYGPDTGMVDVQEPIFEAAAEIVDVWFSHNSNFPGLTFVLLKQKEGDWQINIDFTGHAEDAARHYQDRGAQNTAQPPAPEPTVPPQSALEDDEQRDELNAGQGSAASSQRRSARAGMVKEQSEVPGPPWIKVAVITIGALVVLGGIGGGVVFFMNQKPAVESVKTFEQQRKGFETNLTKRMEAPQKFEESAPDSVKEVEYTSNGKQLKAWLVLPDREPPYPAVIFAHDGFALSRGDYDSVVPFVSQGFAVLIPSFRAENGNPGDFEMCYGEVDDLVNAIDYMATRKKIDRESIFAAGYGVGATTVMLAAELSPHLRKVAVCGGRPDMAEAAAAYENAPFDTRDVKELVMRSPAKFINDLKCPMLLIYAEKEPSHKLFFEQAKKMEKESKKEVLLVEELPGETHESGLAPAISRMLTFFHAR
jgi:dienelactone hydrolase